MAHGVVITGAGVIAPLGDTPAALHAALLAGGGGPHPVELFATDGLACRRAFEVRPFRPGDYLGDRNLRPLDRTSRLLACAARQALVDSGWTPKRIADEDVGLVAGTVYCGLQTISEFDRRAVVEGPARASPMDFANTVINAAAGQTAIVHNLRGVNSTVSAGTASGLQAIAHAAELIRAGRERALLAGGVEELCFASYHGCCRAGLLSGSRGEGPEIPRPFDARRDGFVLGEGAALVMLEDADKAANRGARVLAEVKGHGVRFDPSCGRRPEQAVETIAGAMRQALRAAGLTAANVDTVSASANGSVAGDRHETLALKAVFAQPDRDLSITAVKGLLGETLGAAGGFQVVTMVEAMRTQSLPGLPQLEQLEESYLLNKVRTHNRAVRLRTGLVNAVGWDGNCCALVLAAA